MIHMGCSSVAARATVLICCSGIIAKVGLALYTCTHDDFDNTLYGYS